MKFKKRHIIMMTACLITAVLAFFADKIPFFLSTQEERTIIAAPLTWKYFLSLRPLLYIIAAAVIGIILIITFRKIPIGNNPDPYKGSIGRRMKSRGRSAAKHTSAFSIIRWALMIIFSVLMIFSGWIFGLKMASVNIPILSCPWNTEQMVESSCYYLAHLTSLFELPVKEIITYFLTTILSILLLGRAICGFLCPMGLIQDIMDKIRQKRKIEGIRVTEKSSKILYAVKWTLLLLMIGLCFIGGSFCNFCPAIAVSPVLAGVSVSLYISGFMMIAVLIGSFFKRRIWCNVCPLGYLIGLFHKFSLFRIKKDCQACTECGACYEACPMGIKIIYTEREKANVTEANCIMCGECIKKCPEDNALSMTFAGIKLYTASRQNVMKVYKNGNKTNENRN